MIAGESCPFCGGSGVFYCEKDGFALRECCGCLLSWSWRSEAEYDAFYASDSDYHIRQQEEEGLASFRERDSDFCAAASVRINYLKAHYPHASSVLDVGAGTGAFVAVAAAHDYFAKGIEPSSEMVGSAVALGRSISRGTWRDATGSWNIITLHDVLEHLTRPLDCIACLKQHLSPRGVLYVEMPEAWAPNPDWVRHIRPEQHICLYSDTAARTLFSRAGLIVEAMLRPKRGALSKIGYFIGVDCWRPPE